ncbi:dsDNA nuclease domain-containing protein [Metabacillus idriensis]|uniref:dsDNA nuclease domain-containing protein n=1 Tax=Metabacillus idriensis TaxID=324768 RepID=UPI00174D2F7E|nr:dsDNA nuclease domain-containing protein [Metabacillus idriensis]
MVKATKVNEYDNGGAEAIKGFNFQKANLILLAINNYQKKDFRIYIEAEDDIVVSYESYRALIQVKKQKHTLKSITKPEKKVSKDSEGNITTKLLPSILEKNLRSGTDKDIFKIIVKNIGETDKKQLKIRKPGSICSELHELNDQAKKTIVEALPDDLVSKVDKFYFFISPIHEDLNEAEKYLIGCLNGIDVSVDNKQGRAIIAELALTIDQKAQEVIVDEIHKELKFMDTDYFSKILVTCKSLNGFDTILDSLAYNFLFKKEVKNERLKIELNMTNLKEDMKKALKEYMFSAEYSEEVSDKEIISYLVEKFNTTDTKRSTLISVAIESLCDLGDEAGDY